MVNELYIFQYYKHSYPIVAINEFVLTTTDILQYI